MFLINWRNLLFDQVSIVSFRPIKRKDCSANETAKRVRSVIVRLRLANNLETLKTTLQEIKFARDYVTIVNSDLLISRYEENFSYTF